MNDLWWEGSFWLEASALELLNPVLYLFTFLSFLWREVSFS